MSSIKYAVQHIGINANHQTVYDFIADPKNLPQWTIAFKTADYQSAIMNTPDGSIEIGLETVVFKSSGTVDWMMTMPDGNVAKAYSRITQNGDSAIYSFTLLSPPVSKDKLEAVLAEQNSALAKELLHLKEILEAK